MRDGFVEAGAGVLDSIKDVQNAVRSSRLLRLVQKPEEATILLTIVARSVAGDAGAVAFPIGGVAVLVPLNSRTIQWTLRVNSYESTRASVDRDRDTWRAAADAVVKDVAAWAGANLNRIAD